MTSVYKKNPVVDHGVIVQTASQKIKKTTDKKGQLTVTNKEKGTYIITSDYAVEGKAVVAGNQVDSTYNIVTISFRVD